MKKIVIFTGAGISAESGLSTFRDADGLWEQYRVEDICTHDAWLRNPELCVQFYNERRRDILAAQPNPAHHAITRLQAVYTNAEVITQNIDDLHERAGNQHVTHLHGEIRKLRAENDELATVPIQGWEQHYGDRHPNGALLRPYIVFFGEGVPYFSKACDIASTADILVVVGTSLNVYPAASLLAYAPRNAEIFMVDPGNPLLGEYANRVQLFREPASTGLPKVVDLLLARA